MTAFFQSPRLNNLDKWQHDKFIGSEIKSASLMISNLDFGVSGTLCVANLVCNLLIILFILLQQTRTFVNCSASLAL